MSTVICHYSVLAPDTENGRAAPGSYLWSICGGPNDAAHHQGAHPHTHSIDKGVVVHTAGAAIKIP